MEQLQALLTCLKQLAVSTLDGNPPLVVRPYCFAMELIKCHPLCEVFLPLILQTINSLLVPSKDPELDSKRFSAINNSLLPCKLVEQGFQVLESPRNTDYSKNFIPQELKQSHSLATALITELLKIEDMILQPVKRFFINLMGNINH
jgi:hypothetical protein